MEKNSEFKNEFYLISLLLMFWELLDFSEVLVIILFFYSSSVPSLNSLNSSSSDINSLESLEAVIIWMCDKLLLKEKFNKLFQ